jgi:protein-histidine pros-kinase
LSPLETKEGILVSSAIRDITERQRAEEALRQYAKHLGTSQEREATLNRVIARIRSSLKLEDVLQATVDELLALTQASRCCLYSSQEDSGDVVITHEACALGIHR